MQDPNQLAKLLPTTRMLLIVRAVLEIVKPRLLAQLEMKISCSGFQLRVKCVVRIRGSCKASRIRACLIFAYAPTDCSLDAENGFYQHLDVLIRTI